MGIGDVRMGISMGIGWYDSPYDNPPDDMSARSCVYLVCVWSTCARPICVCLRMVCR